MAIHMNNKIEIGEYVRTKDGHIAKLIEPMLYELSNGESIDFLEDVVKHSKKLINLIEPGDFVNGMKVLNIHIPRDTWEPIEIGVDSRCMNFILADEIRTILTKEQVEANCYKVGGEDGI